MMPTPKPVHADVEKFDKDVREARTKGSNVAPILERALRNEIAARGESVEHLENAAAGLLQEIQSSFGQLNEKFDTLQGIMSNYVQETKKFSEETAKSQKLRDEQIDKELTSLKEGLHQVEVNVGALLGEVSRNNDQDKEITGVKSLILTTKEEQEKEITGVKDLALTIKKDAALLSQKITTMQVVKFGAGLGTYAVVYELAKRLWEFIKG
jgi:chromosome segregation ATPase